MWCFLRYRELKRKEDIMEKKKQGKKTKLKKMKFCRHCGAEMKTNAKTCPNCKKKQGGGINIILIIIIILLLAVIGFLFLSDGTEKPKENNSPSDSQKTAEDKNTDDNAQSEDTTYSIGQPWVVDGQWSLTVNAITPTDQRNEYDERNPAQVFIIDYTYENIGYTDEDGIMNGLFLDLSSGQIVDSAGVMGYSYPGDVTNHVQETPVGAICNAQTCIAVDNASTEVKIIVSQYDGVGNAHSATFVIPVS